MSIKTGDNIEYSTKLSEKGVEDLMGRLLERYQTIYSRVWENGGFKIEYYVGYRNEYQAYLPVVITIEKGPSDVECNFRFFGPRWDVDRAGQELDMVRHPENWGTCYHCGARYFYFESKILEGRVVECQNCMKKFKLDVD
ncbi:MAG: hypothetical protein ACW96N_07865 [Candidatus Thorarchaeota archaeon]|jgi:hypothetical protein